MHEPDQSNLSINKKLAYELHYPQRYNQGHLIYQSKIKNISPVNCEILERSLKESWAAKKRGFQYDLGSFAAEGPNSTAVNSLNGSMMILETEENDYDDYIKINNNK